MKSFLWKIIAIFSVLLGSLGPQVAAGSSGEVVASEPRVELVATMPVVEAAQDVTVVLAQAPSLNCAEAGFQLGRFDLILWHSCDLSLQLGEAFTAPVAVAASQPNWPELSVARGSVNTISSGLASWPEPETSVASFTALTSIGSPQRSTQSLVRPATFSLVSVSDVKVNADNSQLTIVMRC